MSIQTSDFAVDDESAISAELQERLASYEEIPNWKKLPQDVKDEFAHWFQLNENSVKPKITKVVETSDNSFYFTLSTKQVAKTLEDFVIKEFVPETDWDDKFLLLRSDFNEKGKNYVSTALAQYNFNYELNAKTKTDTFEENPMPSEPFKVLLL